MTTALKAALLALGTAVLVASAAAPVQAHEKRHFTQLTASATPSAKAFEGDVLSPKALCKANRRVNIFTAAGALLATTSSNEQGNWHVDAGRGSARIAPGSYFAVAKKRVLKKTRCHRHICRSASVAFQVLP